MGKMFFNILATFAEFEADLIRLRTREGMKIARAKGRLRGKQPKLSDKQQKELGRMHGTGQAPLGRFDVSIRAGSMVLWNASGLVVDSLNHGGLVDRGRQRVPGRSRSGPGWLLRACTRFRRGFSGRSRCGSRHQYQFGPLS